MHQTCFTRDAIGLLSSGEDNKIRLFNVRSKKLSFSNDGHFDSVGALATTPDGRHVVTGSRD